MEYKENNCRIIVVGSEPYLILNLEIFCKLTRNRQPQPHCDFVCIMFENRVCKVYLVEIKNVDSKTDTDDVVSLVL
jgi:hypothetical protein